MRRWILGLMLMPSLLMATLPLCAQAGTRVEVLVPTLAGSAPDLLARLLAGVLNAEGYQAVVKNIPGAAGELGVRGLLRGSADSLTLMLTHNSVAVINPHITDRTEKKLWQHAQAVMLVGQNLSNLVVVTDPRYSSVADLIEKKRAQGAVLRYGSNGVGSFPHLLVEAILARHDPLERLHVPYRGAPDAVQGLMTGDVDLVVSGTAAHSLVASGRLHPLAVAGDRPSPLHPGVPPLARQYKGLNVVPWFALFAHARIPDAHLQNIQRLLLTWLKTPAARERLAAAGIEPLPLVDAPLLARLEQEYELFRQTVERLKLQTHP